MASTAAMLLSMLPAVAGDGENLKLVLIDAETNQPVAEQTVMLWGNEEIRCVRAPCPTRVGILWKGRTSARGAAIVPWKAVKPPAAIEVLGYVRQSFSAGVPVAELRILLARVPPQIPGLWLLLSAAASGPALTVTLIDSATNQPVANQAVSLLGHAEIRCRKAPCPSQGILWTGTTDPQGVVKIPTKAIHPPSFVQVGGYVTQEFALPARGHYLRILLNPLTSALNG